MAIVKSKIGSLLPKNPSYDVINSILGKPVTKDGKNVGTIVGIDPEKDEITFEIDDDVVSDFCQSSSVKCTIIPRGGNLVQALKKKLGIQSPSGIYNKTIDIYLWSCNGRGGTHR